MSAQAALQDGSVVAEMIIQADVSSLWVCMEYNYIAFMHVYASFMYVCTALATYCPARY